MAKNLESKANSEEKEYTVHVILNAVDDNKKVACKGSPRVEFLRKNSFYCIKQEKKGIQEVGSRITYAKEIGIFYDLGYRIEEIKPLSPKDF